MRELLSINDIERFASRKGVKRIAVENFLCTIDESIGFDGNYRNLMLDAQLYRWNTATVKAITDGLKKAFSGEET